MITATLWRSGAEPEALELDKAATNSSGVLVLTVDATIDDVDEVHRQLQGACPEVTSEMVGDLLAPDPLPEVRQYGPIRKVSSFGVRSLDQDRDGDQGLVFEPIEFLAGERWLICHWQRCSTYRRQHGRGLAESSDAEPELQDSIETQVAERWRHQGGGTAGDLGVLFLHELALQYSKARRALWTWLNDWEQGFYSHPIESDPIQFVRPLTELHRLHGELHRRLDGLQIPGDQGNSSWFASVSRQDTTNLVVEITGHSLRNLRSFSESLRQAISLTQSYATLRHFELADQQRKATEKLQNRFELVTAILLVPTLIAGIFGANTLLPGGGHWSGFIGMVVLMVLGGGAAYFALERGRSASAGWLHDGSEHSRKLFRTVGRRKAPVALAGSRNQLGG